MSEPIAKPAPCWVCSYGPHERTDHIYTTEAEAYAEAMRQPPGDYPPLVIDGVLHSYTL